MTQGRRPDPEALREEIRQTRADLGETVQALTSKADVKARVKETTAHKRDELVHQAQQKRDDLMHRAQQKKNQLMHQVQQKRDQFMHRAQQTRNQFMHQAQEKSHHLRERAAYGKERMRGQAEHTGGIARSSAREFRERAQRNPAPFVAAGVGAVMVMYLMARRRRR